LAGIEETFFIVVHSDFRRLHTKGLLRRGASRHRLKPVVYRAAPLQNTLPTEFFSNL
jgi:hypothetical protein